MSSKHEGTYAEHLYNRVKRKNNENEREKSERLAKRYNIILHSISNLSYDSPKPANDILAIKNAINGFKVDSGVLSVDVIRLQDKLSERVLSIQKEINEEQNTIGEKMEKIKNENIEEPPEIIQSIMTQADAELMSIMMRLKRTKDANKTINRRIIGDILSHASRAQAIAIGKLSMLDGFADVVSEKQREKILELSQSQAKLEWDKRKKEKLEILEKQWSKLFMKAFLIRKAVSQIDWIQ